MKASNLLAKRSAQFFERLSQMGKPAVASIISLQVPRNHHQQYRRYSQTSKNEAEEKNIVKAAVMNLPIPNVPFSEYLWSQNGKWEEATALVCGVTEKEIKYHELRELCSKFASVLTERLGFGRGDVLAVNLPNCLEYAQILFGTIEAGVAPTTISNAYTSDEIGHQLQVSGAKAIVTVPERVSNIKKTCSTFGLKGVEIIAVGATNLPPDVLSYEKLMKEAAPRQNNPIMNNDWQEIIPLALPLSHILGFAVMSDAILKGAKVIVLPGLLDNTFIRSLSHYKASLLYVVPPLLNYMSGSSKFGPNEFRSLRTVSGGAAPFSTQEINRFLSKVKQPVRFGQGYGSTETTIITDPVFSTTNLNSVGRPVLNTMIKVIDTITGEALGPGLSGELCIKGPQVMTGYLNNSEATRQAVDSDSWFHSGDIGHYDEDGMFFVTDRIKDLIKVKGFQVAPAEVEAALQSHPSVSDAGVIGVADSRDGETPIAFIVLVEQSKLDVNALKEHLSGVLAKYKIPSKFVPINSIPKSASGKILRKDLKNMAIS